MKNYLLLLFLSVTGITLAIAQTPSKALFHKYENKNGVNLSVSSGVTTMSIDKDDDDRDVRKIFKKISKDCIKLLNNKNYKTLVFEKEENDITKISSYEKNGYVEMCILEISDDSLTLTSTLMDASTAQSSQGIQLNKN
ncbi:MAG: hypothetical protein ACI35V_09315 [Sphingobacterium composti]|uniref:hypothetical protein n=1 Tax=Sphingobacterium composti TaxID=363260 RepID=UPI00135689C9|nr:hypothetical protein [Sphingobacterium composti Ten et al. 2007 non Yoo et al. 2007]